MAKIKRLFNDPYDIVEEMVEGYVGAHKEYVKMCDLDEAQGRVVLANEAGITTVIIVDQNTTTNDDV